MGADAILRTIVEETDREVETLLADARRQAVAIDADARRSATESLAAAVSRAEPELAATAARSVNLVRIQLLHRRTQRTAERLDAVMAEAERRLTEIAADAQPRWGAALTRLACEAITTTGDGSTLRARSGDLRLLRRAFAGSAAGVTYEADPALPPGIVARSADERVEADATLPVRLARARTLLAERLAVLLEPGAC